jgi:hypothetical protein
VGPTLRLAFAPIEAGVSANWDLARDIEDGAISLDVFAGARVFGISVWTPSAGVDYRNAGDFATRGVGGAGFYVANTFAFFQGLQVRLTYRYGFEPAGGLIPVHSLWLEASISPGSAAFMEALEGCGDILDDMDLCD